MESQKYLYTIEIMEYNQGQTTSLDTKFQFDDGLYDVYRISQN